MALTPERWGKVKELFEAVLEETPDRRSSYLEEHCPDPDLRAEVERLLTEHEEAGSFLSNPVIPDIFDAETVGAATVANVATAPPRRLQGLANGELLAGRFRIVRFIAKGGMGEVYEAEDLELHENVAVKTLLPAVAANPKAIQQFKHEIQLARKVTHPNVCRIFDLVYDPRPTGAVTFLTMELLPGITLAKYIEKVRIVPVEETIALAREMAEGLEAAHRAGIIHQDFKPGNVMLVDADNKESRRVVITDFGLAYNARATGKGTGQHGGTPAYMAPEQIQGQPLTVATDIYAFGVVLYELATGRLPYNANTAQELFDKKLQQMPSLPTRYVPDLPARVERTILDCLQRAPEHRPQSAREVMAELDPPRSRWQWLAAASLLLIALGTIGGYEWRARLRAIEPTVAVVGFRNQTGNANFDWLATQLSESLAAEVGGAKGIHSVPSDEVASVKAELSVGQSQTLEHEDLSNVREALGANFLLLGNYAVENEQQGERLNMDVRLQDSRGNTAATIHESGKETDYARLIADASSQIRTKLGAARLSDIEVERLQNLYPSDPEVSRLYFQALDKLRAFDPASALELLKKAAGHDANDVAIHWALADAWTRLRHDREAAQEARMAADLAQKFSLPPEYVVLSQARAAEMNKQWDAAIDDYKSLFRLFPQQLSYGLRLASAQIEGAHARDALSTLDTLANLPQPMGNDPRIEMTRATAYGAMNDFNAELHFAQLALEEARKRNARMMQADAQLQLCWAHRNLGHVDEAFSACNDAQNLFAAFGDNVSAAVALNDVATWLSDRGRYVEAKQLYDRVIQVNQAAGAQKDYTGACINAAKTLILMGKAEDADDYLARALKTSQAIGDKPDEALARIWQGEVHFEQGQVEAAEKEIRLALKLAREVNDKSEEADALSNLALYQSETDSAAALGTYQQVLDLRKQGGAESAVANCMHNIADVLYRRGELNAAEKKFEEVIEIRTRLKENNLLAAVWLSLAQIDLARGNLPAAESQAEKAMREFHDEQDADSESQAASVLINALVADKKAEQATALVKRIQDIGSKDRDVAFENRISLAEYLNAIGQREQALEQIQALPSAAKGSGRNFISLEARLVLVRLQNGRKPQPQILKELAAITADANRAGFKLIVAKAMQIRGSVKISA